MSGDRGTADATLSGALHRITKIRKKVIFENCSKTGVI